MREIKFRAWDKTHKKMLDRVLAGNHDNLCSLVWIKEDKKWVNFDSACGELMQYTGLKDKNGKEIYEGDIVRVPEHFHDCWNPYVHKEWVGVVEYEAPSFYIGGEGYEAFRDVSTEFQPEVIGNIYENPELLEGINA